MVTLNEELENELEKLRELSVEKLEEMLLKADDKGQLYRAVLIERVLKEKKTLDN